MLRKIDKLFNSHHFLRRASGVVVTSATTILLFAAHALASGLDVQLKDLRNSFYFVYGNSDGTSPHAEAKAPSLKECIKLTSKEVRKYGRLLHCEPEDDHVMCRLKTGEKLFAYESKDACDVSLKKGVDPTPI